ncbi:MAG: heterodisulfide reductase-related iron-sulfur binding cluster [Desulfobacterales bacterium]|nr:heterodisulfide reductase-related iron-sulfur binding cluster [Desulfobacterales bacterium]
MEKARAEETARKVVDACADCDVCRHLMDTSCLMFPELYRLWDKEQASGEAISSKELRHLVELCNFCALCPCPNIRADLIKAKTELIDRDGLKFGVRTLEDVARVSKICGFHPPLVNYLFQNKLTANPLKAMAGVHPQRNMPLFPKENFDQWMQRRNPKALSSPKKKVAYFAGCTGRFLFPEVPKAVVQVLERNDIEVNVPSQQCCGMPSMLEGDRDLTLQFVTSNVKHLVKAVKDGYDILCSCPTCGYFFKTVLKAGAYYSKEYQLSVGADDTQIKIPVDQNKGESNAQQFVSLQKSIYQSILKDDGYFSEINAHHRIQVAEKIFDVGEYIVRLNRQGELEKEFETFATNIVYYPPCHLREQNIGQPYMSLLQEIPEMKIKAVDWSLYCCGMAGIMGFKKDFHTPSIQLGSRLMEKINEINPDRIVTDCLSCRLQFNQLTPYDVCHPIEVLNEAYCQGDC